MSWGLFIFSAYMLFSGLADSDQDLITGAFMFGALPAVCLFWKE